MAYAKFRSDLMSGTTNAEDLVTIRYQASSADKDIENGCVVAVGNLMDGEREVRIGTAPVKAAKLDDIAIIGSEEVVKTKAKYSKDEFINKAGENARGYRLGKKHQIFSVTAEALTGTPTKGHVVELDGTNKLAVVASNTSGNTAIGKIIDIEGEWIVIEVGI